MSDAPGDPTRAATPALPALLRDRGHHLALTAVDVGARPIPGVVEPCHRLLDAYPGSRVIGFDVDLAGAPAPGAAAPPGLSYYPCALGRADEERAFYETVDPLCASLYRPDETLMARFHGLAMARLHRTTTIRTRALDEIAETYAIGPIDLLKLDVQGAELDVLRGAEGALGEVLAVVCEVELVPLYERQPLFGDVSAFLMARGFLFHRFLGLAGRTLYPMIVNGDPFYPLNHLWSDALFYRDVRRLSALPPERLLKLAVLADLYQSPDLAYLALAACDQALADAYLAT